MSYIVPHGIGITNSWLEGIANTICNDVAFNERKIKAGLLPAPIFWGVYASDELETLPPKNITSDITLVVNLSPAKTKGSHFVACHCAYDICWYFDPIGMTSGVNPSVEAFFNSRYDAIIDVLNYETRIQGKNSFHCAFFCLAFVCSRMFIDKSCNIEKITKLFVKNFKTGSEFILDENDDIAVKYILQCIKKVFVQ